MKTTKKISWAMFTLVLAINISQAQNYKAPKIDASGKITDKEGKPIGSVTRDGVINDAMGMKVAYVDAEGSIVDAKSGKKLGKAMKNGNYLPSFAKTIDEGWSVSTPQNGTCQVKDKNGNVMAEVHENYKQFGACAIHCLTNRMDHDEILETYACPMHPDVTSDKEGKCSKCGMALVKKKK